MILLVENGFISYEALLTGTVNAAIVVGMMTGEGDFGAVEIGNRADLILAGGNPLEDISIHREPLGVMADSKWYPGETLAKRLEISTPTK